MTSLKVTRVDLQKSANKAAHRTSDYSSETLILRRGQTFQCIVTLSRRLGSNESIGFTVETGPSPSLENKTKADFRLSSSTKKGNWSAVQVSAGSSSSSMTITISIPASAVIGFYRFSVQIYSAGQKSSFKQEDFVILFNPWASDDDVFMSNEAERKEYVLNDFGIIFTSKGSNTGKHWNYAQFEDKALEICLSLLNRSLEYRRNAAADVARRNDPKYVVRVMSAMVNNNDQDNGVVWGNWSGDYSGGVEPTRWSSSYTILRQWYSKGPVKYGQCWVYAAVLCAVLRCLGIPTRVITNFESAHDTNKNLLIDQVIDSSGTILDGSDSVWNFHCWNESWFTRSDIGAMYNGWQIIDATPQETSRGIFRLGPTSLKAIKEGDIELDYDGPFVFAEMNADRVYSIKYPDGTREKLNTDTKSVGQATSTKAVGSNARVDVTNDYKYPEGSSKEREIFKKAQSKLAKSENSLMAFGAVARASATSDRLVADEVPAPKTDISGKFTVEGTPEVGKDISITLSLKNEGSDSLTVKVNISVTAITYTRKPMHEVMKDSQSITLAPKEEKKISLTITYAQYEGHLTEHNLIQVNAVCEPNKGGKLLVDRDINLKSPPVIVKVDGQAVVNKPLSVEIIFANPIDQDVNNCELMVEGSGLMKEMLKIRVESLKRNQTSKVRFAILPYKSGPRYLLVCFSSDKFSDVKGAQEITVAST